MTLIAAGKYGPSPMPTPNRARMMWVMLWAKPVKAENTDHMVKEAPRTSFEPNRSARTPPIRLPST